MHELGVVFSVIKDVEEVAAENAVTDIKSVTIELGEVSTVIPSYLSNCWKWAVKRTEIMQNASLIIETLPAITYCEDCKETYGTVEHGKTCPHCGSEHTYLIQGQEFNIKQIEACQE